jgi:hypothetical protein
MLKKYTAIATLLPLLVSCASGAKAQAFGERTMWCPYSIYCTKNKDNLVYCSALNSGPSSMFQQSTITATRVENNTYYPLDWTDCNQGAVSCTYTDPAGNVVGRWSGVNAKSYFIDEHSGKYTNIYDNMWRCYSHGDKQGCPITYKD